MTFAVTINIKASRRAHTAEEGEKEEPFHALLARPARRRDVDGRTSLLYRWPVGPTSSSPFYHGAYKNPRIYPLRSYQSEERDREGDFDFFFLHGEIREAEEEEEGEMGAAESVPETSIHEFTVKVRRSPPHLLFRRRITRRIFADFFFLVFFFLF